jgi:competence protein ComEC
MRYFLSLISGVALFQTFQYFPHLSALIALSACVFMATRKKYVIIVLIVLGFFYAFIRHSPEAPSEGLRGKVVLTGSFQAPARSIEGGFSQEFQVASGPPVRTLDIFSGREFEIGRGYELAARVITPRQRLNPGSGRSTPYAVLMEVRGAGDRTGSIAVFFNRIRDRLNRLMRESFEPDSAALLMAVTTGQRSYLSDGLRGAFASTGLAHLLSISGTHFAFFFVLLFGLFRVVIKYLPARLLERVTVYLTPSQASAALSLPFMLLYLGISGASIPSIRAFVMISLFLFGLLVERGGHWLNFLLLAALGLVLWEPEVLLSVSFQLSFIAVLFIGFGLRGRPGLLPETKAEGIKNTGAKRLLRPMVKTLLATLYASIGVAPLVAYYFHYLSTISPASNVVITPLVGFLLVPLSLTGSFLHLLTGGYFLGPVVARVSDLTVSLVGAFASVPWCSLRVPLFPVILIVLFYAGFVLYWVSGKRYVLALSFLPVAAYALFTIGSSRPLSVTFLDAGRADASVIELPDGRVIVIDTGWSGREVAGYLRLRGHGTIDALVLSHAHPDHTGGAGRLLERFETRELWDNGRLVYPSGFLGEGLLRRSLSRGDVLDGEGYSIQVLHPYNGFYTASGDRDDEMNNDSLVLRLKGGRKAFLFAGDIKKEAEEDLSHLGRWLRSDVLKVPHHGLKGSVHEGFLQAVSPQVAVLTSSDIDEEMRRSLGGAGIFLTGSDGAVKIEEGPQGIRVKTYNDLRIRKTRSVHEELENIKRLFMTW